MENYCADKIVSSADICRLAFDLVALSKTYAGPWKLTEQIVVKWSIGSALVVLMGVFHNAEACGNTRGKSAYKGVWYHCTCSAGYTQPAFPMSDLSDSAHEETNYEGRSISSHYLSQLHSSNSKQNIHNSPLLLDVSAQKVLYWDTFIYLTWYQYFQLP